MASYFEQEVYSGSEEESGAEDSDEDIITDYLSPLDDNGNVNASTVGPDHMEASSDVAAPAAAPSSAPVGDSGGAIPTISVTQHSPAASKAFFILEDNLRQLHGIQESIQRMREVSIQTLRLQVSRRRLRGAGGSCNWSSSCPSLSTAGAGPGNNNEADWLLSGVGWDSPTPPGAQYWGDGGSRKGSLIGEGDSGTGGGSKRRRSWASPWEADETSLTASAGDGRGGGRPRSVSLSSADTDENEPEGGGGPSSRPTGSTRPSDHSDGIFSSRSLKVLTGGHSTHSLHEMGFPLIPALPAKIRGVASKESVGEPSTKWLSPRILTLQKSISTPSILAVKDAPNVSAKSGSSATNTTATSSATSPTGHPVGLGVHKDQQQLTAGPASSFVRLSPYTGLESETDDDSELPPEHQQLLSSSSHYSLSSFAAEPGFENDDDANSSKRRKRGSLFFRKRKDKEKEKEKSSKLKQPHQFVSVCHSNSQPCDVCAKSLTNKAALRCESCAITVHEHTCRDQVHDCTRFKVPKSIPLSSKVSLASLTGVGKQAGGFPPGPAPPSGTNPSAAPAASSSFVAGSSSIQHSAGSSAVTTPTSSSQQTPSTPISSPLFSANSAVSKLSGLSQRSQWKRVAAKLGVNKSGVSKESDTGTLYEETISGSSSHGPNNEASEGLVGASEAMEVVDVAEVKDLDLDPELGILDEEAEAWVGTVDKKISKKLKEKEIKRQEHIYEFIITEKHHCLTLKVMQKVFAEGMRREMRFTAETVDRIFPCLEELLEYHLQFLRRLRHRQRQEPVVATIEDILRLQFFGPLGDQLRSLYGEFCSRHQEAVSMYKEMVKEDRKFAAFARQCTMNPLCKKKGIPECILFVTQRITKYPLLIDPLIKTSREQPDECLKLQQVLGFVKDILVGVNAQVAEKERKLRLIEIYNKIDAKSATTYKNKKFKKSDLLSNSRRLMFEGVAYLNHARGKVQLVTVVVLSDVVFFLQESNQKFHFVTQDNKAGVISLQKLLVREKAGGQDTRSIYLISSNPEEPEMYELQCQTPREKRIWIETIRAAVEQCPEDDEEDGDLVSQGREEELRKIREAQEIKTRQLIGSLREKDRQLAALLEDKMSTFCELVELLANNEDSTNTWAMLGSEAGPPKYNHLVEQGFQSQQARDTLAQALAELHRLLGLLFSSSTAGGWNWMAALSRSASSVGERHSETFALPSLPKRAETFGGFDHPGAQVAKDKGAPVAGVKKKSATDLNAEGSAEQAVALSSQIPLVLQLSAEQQVAGLELTHNVNTLLSLLASQATAFEALRSEFLAEAKAVRSGAALTSSALSSGSAGFAKFQHKASHNQRLEELRNLQDRLSKEKAEWQRERAMQEEQISEQRKQLLKLQEQVRVEHTDVQQQRENLYQKLEALRGQGILLSPNMTIVTTAPNIPPSATSPSGSSGVEEVDLRASSPTPSLQPTLIPSPTPSASDLARRKTISGGLSSAGIGQITAGLTKRESCSNLPLPMNLLSAKNEQKAGVALSSNLPIKQQLPMKLAKLAASGGTGTTTGAPGAPAGPTGGAAPPRLEHSPSGIQSPGSSGGIVQQLLPLRLSESLSEHSTKRAASPKVQADQSFKPKLSSSSFSPPTSKGDDFVAGHNRTGSSPASIQVLSSARQTQYHIPHHQHHPTQGPPKVPEKPATLLLQQAAGGRGSPQLPPPPPRHPANHQSPPPPPPKVHDPETNQEIVFL